MKVKELMAALKRAPQNAEVIVTGHRLLSRKIAEAYPNRHYRENGKWLFTQFIIETEKRKQ